jgi:hypothetical protein
MHSCRMQVLTALRLPYQKGTLLLRAVTQTQLMRRSLRDDAQRKSREERSRDYRSTLAQPVITFL